MIIIVRARDMQMLLRSFLKMLCYEQKLPAQVFPKPKFPFENLVRV